MVTCSRILKAILFWIATPVLVAAGSFPDEASLQSGDLLWPKAPEAVILYSSEGPDSSSSDRSRWEADRKLYLDQLRARPSLTSEDKQRFQVLSDLDYEEFRSVYFYDEAAGRGADFGTALGVGHVAIVRRAQEGVFVVEAMLKHGVREISYRDWMVEREGQEVWHGRVRELDEVKRSEIAKLALEQVGKPYDFWNFDLSDASGFYCSKLAWMAISSATGIYPDDRPDPRRALWYSPKQLLNSRHIELLRSPGNYGTD